MHVCTYRPAKSLGWALMAWFVMLAPSVEADEAQGDPSQAASPVSAELDIELIDQAVLLKFLAGGDDFVLIDARSPEEYAAGHIARAINVPHDAVEEFAQALPADVNAPLVVYCKTGKRASALRDALLARGHTDVRVLGPRQIFWTPTAPVFNCGVPTETAPPFLPVDEESPPEVNL